MLLCTFHHYIRSGVNDSPKFYFIISSLLGVSTISSCSIQFCTVLSLRILCVSQYHPPLDIPFVSESLLMTKLKHMIKNIFYDV